MVGLLYTTAPTPEDAPRVVVFHDEDLSIESSTEVHDNAVVGDTWVVRRPMAT
ncbi:hypothetical protein Pcac1_g754 [Phytophthora cactorum]|nr:hypothetical protein Pcac1_g754 [Phytophthora cactorum]